MRPSHIAILLILALLIFGAPRLPMLARSLGESLKIIKKDAGELLDSSIPSPGAAPASAPEAATAAEPARTSSLAQATPSDTAAASASSDPSHVQ